jgi:glycosyltransferase involved in cell wall biosynthesis
MSCDLSVVIPIRNEAPNIEALCTEFRDVLDAWGRTYELIAVDDGSDDESVEALRRMQRTCPRLRVIRFRRNFGQTAAFAAGFACARGALVATADGDLQSDPRDIPLMVERLEREDVDVVCGWRKERKDAFVTRELPSRLANALIARVTGVRVHDCGCSLKVFRREIAQGLRLYGELHRLLPALASEQGARLVEQVVRHRPRLHGRSKYGLSRTFRVLLDLKTVWFLRHYGTRPMQFFGAVGAALGAAGLLLMTRGLWVRFVHHTAGATWWVLGGVALVSGVQCVLAGLLAELQMRTYYESQNRAVYVVREILEP